MARRGSPAGPIPRRGLQCPRRAADVQWMGALWDPAGPHSPRLSRASVSYITVTLAGAGACLAGLAFPGMIRPDRVGLMLAAIGVMVAVGVVTVLWTAAWRWVAHLQGGVLLGGGCVIMSCLADPIQFSLAAGWFSLIPILFATSLSRRWVTGYLVVAVGLSLFSIATFTLVCWGAGIFVDDVFA